MGSYSSVAYAEARQAPLSLMKHLYTSRAGPIIPLVYKCFNRSWRVICKNEFRWQGGWMSLLRRGLWLENERLVRIATTLNFSCTCYRMGGVETSRPIMSPPSTRSVSIVAAESGCVFNESSNRFNY